MAFFAQERPACGASAGCLIDRVAYWPSLPCALESLRLCRGIGILGNVTLTVSDPISKVNNAETSPSQKRVLLLKPRGFCAGVVRAIDIVKIALETFGAPIYVRREIV